ncbi:adult enhancer factor 1-like [Ambystoma mexicanum]|uniref:adult enhancer factor 1-like n=1 Tax=Ambystoma mexicanum TaxID=8296 RepID=UPI0037E99982
MEPASHDKGSRQPWKTEPLWDSQEWGRPLPSIHSNPKMEELPDCNPVPKSLDGADVAVTGPAKSVKVEPPSKYDEFGSGDSPALQPKKKAIWKLLGSTSYPLVPKWTSYQNDSKGPCSFPGYRNHGSKAYQGWRKDSEEPSAAIVPALEFCKFKKQPVSKSKAVFSPMLNSLLTVKTPVPESIQENTQGPMHNHHTRESILGLKGDPGHTGVMTSGQSTVPQASPKPRGPYRAKVSPSLKHSSENTQSEPEPSSSAEEVPNSSVASVNSSVLGIGGNALSNEADKSSDQKPTPESRFLLIDDQGVPYTLMKREMENKPKEEHAATVDEKPPAPKKLHYCLVCYRTFLYLSDLERHSITHSEHKPFECKACGKTFKRSSHLQRHKHIHTGERPFLCLICQKGFRESGELHRHQRVHTGEKPFQCELCHLRFTERNTLRRHIKRKHTLDNLFQQDSDNLSDWGEAFSETPEEDIKASSDQALSDNTQKSLSSSPSSSPLLH